jgi:hypothetical protein
LEEYIEHPSITSTIRRMATQLKEKWDYMATVSVEYSDEDIDENEDPEEDEAKLEKLRAIQRKMEQYRAQQHGRVSSD